MSSNYYRNQNRIKGKISNFLKTNKVLIIICLALFVFFFFVGVFTVNKHKSDFEIDNIFNKYFLKFIKGDISWLTLFFSYFIISLIVFLLLSFLSFSSFLIIIDLFFLCLISYLVGFDVSIYIISFSFFGLLNFLIFMLLPMIIILFLGVVFICVKFRRCREIKKFGKYSCCKEKYFTNFALIFILICIVEFLMCLLLLFTKISIIS